MKLLYASHIEKIETRADRTLKIVIGTSTEMSAADKAALFSLSDQNSWTLHSTDDDLTEVDVPDERPDTMTGRKTKAQTLRAVIWRIWEQSGKKGSSEDHYQRVMDSLINQMKDKLDG